MVGILRLASVIGLCLSITTPAHAEETLGERYGSARVVVCLNEQIEETETASYGDFAWRLVGVSDSPSCAEVYRELMQQRDYPDQPSIAGYLGQQLRALADEGKLARFGIDSRTASSNPTMDAFGGPPPVVGTIDYDARPEN